MWWQASEESPRMFQSDFIDSFSRIPWQAVPIIYVPMTSALLIYAVAFAGMPIWQAPLWALAGFMVWTLTEYWLHRTLFHWTPATSWGPQFHFFLHGVHHDWFQDRLRLVMPPAASLFLAVIFFGMYYGAAQALAPWVDPSWAYALFAGKIIGYMNYDLTHYYLHHGKPKSKMFKKLRHHHNAHHHNKKFKDAKFGVSTTLWDHVFGTYGE